MIKIIFHISAAVGLHQMKFDCNGNYNDGHLSTSKPSTYDHSPTYYSVSRHFYGLLNRLCTTKFSSEFWQK